MLTALYRKNLKKTNMFEVRSGVDAFASLVTYTPFASLKIHRQRTNVWHKVSAVFLILLVLPISCEKGQSPTRSNTIDKRKFSSESSYDDQNVEDYTTTPQLVGCGACTVREEIKSRSLEAIKGDVLRKMGFQSAPNVTGRVLPQVPPHILAMVDQGYAGMQSDEPQYRTGPSISEEVDDFHVKTKKVITFAQPCKYSILLKATNVEGPHAKGPRPAVRLN